MLVGCGSIREAQLDDVQSAQTIPDDWFHQSESKQELPSEPLIHLPQKLTQLLEQQLSATPELVADHARYQIARYDLAAIEAERWPSANLSVTGQRKQTHTNEKSEKNWGEGFASGLRVSWEPDVWGKLNDKQRAGWANFESFRLEYKAAQQSLISRVLLSYFELQEFAKLIELTETNLKSQQRRVDITASRLDAGLLDSHDLRLAMNSLNSIQANLIQQRLNYHRAKQGFNLLLGRYPEASVEELMSQLELPSVTVTVSPKQIMQQRPDLIAAEFRLTQAYYQKRAADKSRLPDLTLRLNAVASGAEEFSQLFDWKYWLASLTAELSQNLFDGGKISANQQEQKVRQALALAQYRAKLLTSWQEVERGIYSESMLRSKHSALALAFEQIRAAEEKLNQQYEAGLASSFELLSIQERRIRNETELTRAQFDILANRVRLILALGESFPVALSPVTEGSNS